MKDENKAVRLSLAAAARPINISPSRVVSSPRGLLEGEGWRIRDVAVGPQDGYIYIIADHESEPLLRLVPDENDDG